MRSEAAISEGPAVISRKRGLSTEDPPSPSAAQILLP